jgi:hypothetical protein
VGGAAALLLPLLAREVEEHAGALGPLADDIDHGSPRARGRPIFGGLVPCGEVGRLGANWATTLMLDVEMEIGDLGLPRGEYTLFLLPREDGGDLIVSDETRQ